MQFWGKEYKWIKSIKQHMKKHDGHDDEIGLPTKVAFVNFNFMHLTNMSC